MQWPGNNAREDGLYHEKPSAAVGRTNANHGWTQILRVCPSRKSLITKPNPCSSVVLPNRLSANVSPTKVRGGLGVDLGQTYFFILRTQFTQSKIEPIVSHDDNPVA